MTKGFCVVSKPDECPAPPPGELHDPLQSIEGTSTGDIRKDTELGYCFSVYKLQSLGMIAKESKEPDDYFKSLAKFQFIQETRMKIGCSS